mmetsp:Transcript_23436/g.37511  ORF Transcript_23436/g.37511 Transcript_23436/m.37511 type:complete len:355 (+) Transcript_23436:87-1151(+)
MGVLSAIDEAFTRFCQHKYTMVSVLTCLLAIDVATVVLSVQQAFPENPSHSVWLLGGWLSQWNIDVCRNVIVQFISPFRFHFRIHDYSVDLGVLSCPWRERNSVFRCSLLTLVMVAVVWQFLILKTKSGAHFWWFISWSYYILFLFFCGMFVFDADGVYSGYNACLNNFEFGGFGPIIFQLIGAGLTTTLPPYFYQNPFFVPHMKVNNDKDTLVIEDFAIADGCFLEPYSWVLLCDFLLCIMCYLVFRVSKIHEFEDRDRPVGLCQCRTGGGSRKKHKTSLAEYNDGSNYEYPETGASGNTAHTTTVAVSTEYANIFETEIHGDNGIAVQSSMNPFFEPEEWNVRKPTYEKNFS